VREEWEHQASEQAIRDFYDAIWVYGDPRVYDLVQEYELPRDLAARVSYTGYFDQRQRLTFLADAGADLRQDLRMPPGRLVLGMMGGGQDGTELAEAFVETDFPPNTNAVLITGPFMPVDVQSRLRRAVAGRRRFRLIEFLPEPDLLLRHASRVVAMGGYNTVSEILSFDKRALIVPRIKPRTEQLIRAQRLQEMGLVDMLHPDDVTPAALSSWFASESQPRPPVRARLDFNGLARLPHLFSELFMGSTKLLV
jgi:predicted glycosyltransferase